MQNFGRENFDDSTCIHQNSSDFSTIKVLRYTVAILDLFNVIFLEYQSHSKIVVCVASYEVMVSHACLQPPAIEILLPRHLNQTCNYMIV